MPETTAPTIDAPVPVETPPVPVVPAAPTAPVAAPVEPPVPVKVGNPWDDPAAAQAEIERLRRENGKDRTNAKATAAAEAEAALAQKIGKALGLVKDDEPADPAKLTEQLTVAGAQARQARVELAVYRAAAGTADPAALLDSRTFLASVQDIDPADVAALTAAITAAVQANPRLGAAPTPGTPRLPAPNPAQGSSASGSPSAAAQADAEYDRYFPSK